MRGHGHGRQARHSRTGFSARRFGRLPASMEDLRHHLKAEGYLDTDAQLTGPKIRTQLRALIEQAKRK
jgi:hypothetical protein